MDHILDLPFPDLKNQKGEADAEYFLQPAGPCSSAGRLISPHTVKIQSQIPSSFGGTYPVYWKARTENEFESRLVFVRRDKGSLKNGIQRENAAAYEKAKFNVLLYPGNTGKNGIHYGKDDHWKDMEPKWQSMLRLHTWPQVFRAPTIAPFMRSRHGFTMPVSEQPVQLTSICKTLDVFQLVLNHLIREWETLSNLGRSCQMLFDTIGATMMHCDMSTGNFLDMEKSDERLAELVKEGALTSEQAEKTRVSPFIIVSPVRQERNEDKLFEESRLNENGYDDNSDMKFWRHKYEFKMKWLFKLFRSIHHRSNHFQHLLLQRIPFLNVAAVKAIVKALPCLKSIGIHNCELMTLSATAPLIEAVRDTNADLDFYPRYFQGPVLNSLGCYGVMHQDEGLFEIPRAVGATLLHVVRLAIDAGIDLISPGKAFRRWLDKIPFHLDTLPHILEGIVNLHKFRRGAFGVTFPPAVAREMEMTLWFDIIIAINGAPMREQVLKKMVKIGDRLVVMSCCECGERLPAFFFLSDVVARRDEFRICHGCQLLQYLDAMFWDMARHKRDIANTLWDYGRIQDLSVLLDGLSPVGPTVYPHRLRVARRQAKKLDERIKTNERDHLRLEDEIAALRAQVAGMPPFDELMDIEEDIRCKRKQLTTIKTRLGIAQWRGDNGEFIKGRSSSWQQQIAMYRATVDMETGKLQNNGPYELRSKENFLRDCNGFW